MLALELLTKSSALFLFFLFIFLCPGLFVSRLIGFEVSGLRLLLLFSFSIFYLLIITVLCLPNSSMHQWASVVLTLSLVPPMIFFLQKLWQSPKLLFDCWFPLLCLFLFYLLCTVMSYGPTFEPSEGISLRVASMFSLPIDNLIPYNTARFFLERISPLEREVVPTWNVLERGPVSGLLVASVFFLLRVKEYGAWLSPDEDSYFIYQQLLMFLNSFALVAVWEVASKFGGRRAGSFSVLFLISTFFFLLNTVYTWPKFFMASLLLLSLVMGFHYRKFAFSGLLFALSVFIHDSAVFCLPGYFAVLIWQIFVGKKYRKKDFIHLLLFSVFPILSWQLIKSSYSVDSSRMLYHHLLCWQEVELPKEPIFLAYVDYLKNQSLSDLLALKISNLWYPFDLFHVFDANIKSVASLYNALSHLSFFQFVHGVSFIAVAMVIFSICVERGQSKTRSLVLVTFGALFFAAIVYGCRLSTWSHHWAYPAFLTTSIVVGLQASVSARRLVCFSLAVIFNILIWWNKYSVVSKGQEFISVFIIVQLILFVSLISILLISTLSSDFREKMRGKVMR